MRIIRKKLERMVADKCLLPKTEKYDAVHYMLNEWDGLMNIFTRGDYHLDNNLVERLNRYIGENGAFPPTRDGCIHSLSMRERG